MATPRQLALLAKEDWRFHAIDVVGTGLGMLATTELLSGRHLTFGLPSAPAIYLNLARNAHANRTAIDVEASFVTHPSPQGAWPEEHKLVFDFFEAFVAEVIFSFTAVEAFANESIPSHFSYVWKKDGKAISLSGAEIERSIAINEKLKRVLPLAHKITSPAGTQAWERYLELKAVRDRLVHLKSIDRKPSGPENQTIWGLMLKKRHLDFPTIAYGLIASYEPLVSNRRWFRFAGRT